MSVEEMRTLRWIHSKSRKDRIRNEHFQDHLGVASIDDGLRETHLRWYGNVQVGQLPRC